MGILDGLRVVELSTDVAGAYTGRLLALYGADVVVVEPPDGHAIRRLPPWPDEDRDPEDSILFAYLGAGKRSVRLDLARAEDIERARRLVAWADAVIDTHAPGHLAQRGLDLGAMAEERPALVVTQVTPYGQTGPKAHWRATALTAFAAGGQMNASGDAERPPLKAAGHQAHYQTALHAFSSTLTAVYVARTTGVGDVLDISIQEVQAAKLEGGLPGALLRGSESGRSGNGPTPLWGVHQTRDWWIGIAAMPRQSFAVYDLIEHPELKDDPAFASGWSPPAAAVLGVLVPDWARRHTADEIFARADEARAPVGMILTPRQLLEWPHLCETGFWHEVEHPRLGRHPLPSGPVQFGRGPSRDRGENRRAPLIGEHTEEVFAEIASREPERPASSARPGTGLRPALEGVRVVDTTQVWAGPYATRLLADAGADVVKVEGPTFEDPIRTTSGNRTAPAINSQAYFNEYNRNKLGMSLDLKQTAGVEAIKRLVARSDVFVENWSSGVADRMGLGYEDLRTLNPGLIYVSMPGFGHEGPDARRVGFGPTIEQMAGLVSVQGYEGGAPHRSGISYGDPMAGAVTAGAIVAALTRRHETGEGCYVMVPQRDGIIGMIGEYVLAEALGCPLPARIGSRDPYFAPHNVYRAADGELRVQISPLTGDVLNTFTDRWVTIAVDSEEAWDALKRTVGDPALDDPAYDTMDGRRSGQDEIDAAIEEWTCQRDAEEIEATLQAAGVAAAAVSSCLLITRDPHMAARDNWLTYDHPDTGVQKTLRSVWRFARRPQEAIRHAPRFGGDSDEVLASAGYSPEEILSLRELGVTTTELR